MNPHNIERTPEGLRSLKFELIGELTDDPLDNTKRWLLLYHSGLRQDVSAFEPVLEPVDYLPLHHERTIKGQHFYCYFLNDEAYQSIKPIVASLPNGHMN